MAKQPASSEVIRTPMQTVVVQRNGESVVPTIGHPFSFTKDEVEQIERMNPSAISKDIVLDADDPAVKAAVTGGSSDQL